MIFSRKKRAPREHRIDFYAKPGCHLCDEARQTVERVAAELAVPVVEHNILSDAQLQEDYGELIPVVVIDGRQHATWRVDEARLRQALL